MRERERERENKDYGVASYQPDIWFMCGDYYVRNECACYVDEYESHRVVLLWTFLMSVICTKEEKGEAHIASWL